MNENSLAALLRTAPGLTRHPIAIWLNQMLWLTNMAPQSRAAQRTLSCQSQKMLPPGRQCGSCVEMLFISVICQLAVQFISVNFSKGSRKRCLHVTQVLLQKEMVRISQRWRSPVAKYAMQCFWMIYHMNRGGFMEVMLLSIKTVKLPLIFFSCFEMLWTCKFGQTNKCHVIILYAKVAGDLSLQMLTFSESTYWTFKAKTQYCYLHELNHFNITT